MKIIMIIQRIFFVLVQYIFGLIICICTVNFNKELFLLTDRPIMVGKVIIIVRYWYNPFHYILNMKNKSIDTKIEYYGD